MPLQKQPTRTCSDLAARPEHLGSTSAYDDGSHDAYESRTMPQCALRAVANRLERSHHAAGGPTRYVERLLYGRVGHCEQSDGRHHGSYKRSAVARRGRTSSHRTSPFELLHGQRHTSRMWLSIVVSRTTFICKGGHRTWWIGVGSAIERRRERHLGQLRWMDYGVA